MIATLVSAAALAMMLAAQGARLESAESLRFLKARMRVESLAARAIVRLDEEVRTSATPESACFVTEEGSACWRSADGLVDLNAAQEDSFVRLFIALGMDTDRAKENARNIVEARAKRVAAGKRPAFQYETELLQLDLSKSDTDKALPYVTVFSGLPYPISGAMPPELQPYFAKSAPDPFSVASFGRVYIIQAQARFSRAAVIELRRWVRPTGNPRQPMLIHRQEEHLTVGAEP